MAEDYHLSPIPEIFHSYVAESPFTRCLECDKDLMNGEPYVIEKAYKQHIEYGVKDVVFDYALCMPCVEKLRKQMSQESIETVNRFFMERMDPVKSQQKLVMSPDENIEECMLSGENLKDCQEYQIYAYCVMDKLSYEMPPYMISGKVMDELLPLLSQKSTDELNGFLNKHFSPDPSLMEPVGPRFVPF
jgi:hypothetical protein